MGLQAVSDRIIVSGRWECFYHHNIVSFSLLSVPYVSICVVTPTRWGQLWGRKFKQISKLHELLILSFIEELLYKQFRLDLQSLPYWGGGGAGCSKYHCRVLKNSISSFGGGCITPGMIRRQTDTQTFPHFHSDGANKAEEKSSLCLLIDLKYCHAVCFIGLQSQPLPFNAALLRFFILPFSFVPGEIRICL